MNNSLPDQRPVWNGKHDNGDHEKLRHVPSPFASVAEPYFPRESRVLELGCGVGRDAEMFAEKGHQVLATDGSEVVIRQNQQEFADKNISFQTLDIREPLPFAAESFDVVYANLALHYFSDQKTREIFAHIANVLKPNGVFAFSCKSYDDAHNSGKEVEPGVFVSPTGVAIHLFSVDYAKSLPDDLFSITYIDEVGEKYNGRFSKLVRGVATKVNKE